MGSARALFTGHDNIMSGFETFIKKYPFYSLSAGNTLLWQGGNTPEDYDELSNMIESAEMSGNTDILYIKFYDSDIPKPITNKTPNTSTMICQAVAKQGRGDMGIGSVQDGRLPRELYMIVKAMEGIPDQFANINKRLNEMEAAEPEEVKDDSIIGKIGAFLETPIGGMLLTRLLPGVPVPAIGNAKVSGTGDPVAANIAENVDTPAFTEDQVDQIDAIIDRLAVHCDVISDLGLLADLAEKQPQIFKMMLMQLRSKQ